VLTRRDDDDIRSDRRAAWRRSAALLDLLTSENNCNLQHVVMVNLITQNGGQNNKQLQGAAIKINFMPEV